MGEKQMKNWEKIGLVISFIALIIVAVLYGKAKQENRNLNAEIEDLKNQIKKDSIASITNSTPAYIPEGVPVAEPNENSENEPPQTEFHRNPENVTIEVLEDTITRESAEILITDKNEDFYGWGEDFRLEKKRNGNWEKMETLGDNLIFNALAYLPKENGELKMKVKYGNYYGTLENGIYRIVKSVYDGGYIDLYSNEFEIK